jgi:hypothetical protein
MKQYVYILTVLLLLPKIALCKDADKPFRFAVSVNLSSPLIQAINKNKTDSSSFRIPTNIALSAIIHKNWMIRIGAGGFNNNQSISSDIFTDRKIENITKISVLASIYRVIEINDRWNCGLGLSGSAVKNQSEFLFDSGFDVLKSYTYSKGGGIGGGVFFQYQINNRISMFSEYNAMYNIYQSADGKEFSSYPDQNYAKSKQLNQGIQFQFPLAIYFNYLF